MKHILVILSFLLSFLFSDGNVHGVMGRAKDSPAVVEAAGEDRPGQGQDYDSPAILPFESARFSGEDNSVAPSFRTTNSGRRTQVSQKSPFRIFKEGKVIDRSSLHFFQAQLHQFESGVHSGRRYIHSICQLLI